MPAVDTASGARTGMLDGIAMMAGIGLAVGGALWFLLRGSRSPLAPSLSARAEGGELGLRWQHGRWEGDLGGRGVILHPATHDRPGSVWVDVLGLLPAGAALQLPVGQGEPISLGGSEWGRVGPRALGRLPELVGAAADGVAERGWRCKAGPSVQIEGVLVGDLRPALDAALALAGAIEAGLQLLSCPPALRSSLDDDELRARGTVDGVPVELELPTLSGRGWQFVVRATLDPPLPPGTLIEGDWPGSRVQPDAVVHVVSDDRLDVAAAVDRCVALAHRLRP